MIATPHIALDAAAAIARPAGVPAHILGNAIEGGTREVGKVMTGIALQVAERGQPFHSPCVLLSGGETTVTLSGQGRGGCNVEFLLSLGVALNGHPRIHAWRATPTALTGRKRLPARCSLLTRWRVHGTRHQAPGQPGQQRRSRLFSSLGRFGDHRPRAHQRQRLSCDLHRRTFPRVTLRRTRNARKSPGRTLPVPISRSFIYG